MAYIYIFTLLRVSECACVRACVNIYVDICVYVCACVDVGMYESAWF